ncbi:MAG: patatin-like phospholipase family protein, partial [Pyrinomonadaceae bacterium]|nr:patatin-like phospholipase family protein [Pyrinomonadaceae bacterium]
MPKAVQPVVRIPADPLADQPRSGIGLCLSGGGYRAMLFHLGTFCRLNEFGYLPKLDRISSVSGGSITAGVLALNWTKLEFNALGIAQNLIQLIVEPVTRMASKTIDVSAVLLGLFSPGGPGYRIANSYDRVLFSGGTLQDFPLRPRFVINATNVQSTVLWRFSKPYMRDYRVGEVKNPQLPIAVAVAASSAFPPVLSPFKLSLDDFTFTPSTGTDLQTPPYTSQAVLTDGGVYDNLGLETVWKEYETVLVSDAGG